MMETFAESLDAGFAKDDGWYSFKFGAGYELTFEPLLFDDQWYVALYGPQNQLLTNKVVVKPGKTS